MRTIVLRDRTEVAVSEEQMAECPQVASLRRKYAAIRKETEVYCNTPRYIEDPQVCSFCLVRNVAMNRPTCNHDDCREAMSAFLLWADEHLHSATAPR